MNIIGFPSIHENLTLQKAIDSFSANKISEESLQEIIINYKKSCWELQKKLSHVCINDFSLYDNMLDLSIMLGIIPERFNNLYGLERYFAMANGHKQYNITACKSAKWFNTYNDFIIPELSNNIHKISIEQILLDYNEAKNLLYTPKICLIGFFTYFALATTQHNEDKKQYFQKLKLTYLELICALSSLDKKVCIEFHEPIFTQESDTYCNEIIEFYNTIVSYGIQAIVTTSFQSSNKTTSLLCKSNIDGIGLDFIYGSKNLESLEEIAKSGKKLYAGLIDGQNIWSATIDSELLILDKISIIVPKDLIHISTSCPLKHLPFYEKPYPENNEKIDSKDKDEFYLPYFSFAKEKIKELEILESIFRHGITEDNKSLYEQKEQTYTNSKQALKKYNPIIRQELFFLQKEQATRRLRTKHKKTPNSIIIAPHTHHAINNSLWHNKDAKNQHIYSKDYITLQEKMGFDIIDLDGIYTFEKIDGIFSPQNIFIQDLNKIHKIPNIVYGDLALQTFSLQNESVQNLTKKPCKKIINAPLISLSQALLRNDISKEEIYMQYALCLNHAMRNIQKLHQPIFQINELLQHAEILESKNDNCMESLFFKILATMTLNIKNTQIHLYLDGIYAEKILDQNKLEKLYALDIDVLILPYSKITFLEQYLKDHKSSLPCFGIQVSLDDIITESNITKSLQTIISLSDESFFINIDLKDIVSQQLDSHAQQKLNDFISSFKN